MIGHMEKYYIWPKSIWVSGSCGKLLVLDVGGKRKKEKGNLLHVRAYVDPN